MVKVKTLRAHGNRFGKQYDKAVGDIYDIPDAGPLIVTNLVELAADGDGNGKDGGSSGSGDGARGSAAKPSEGPAAKGAEKKS